MSEKAGVATVPRQWYVVHTYSGFENKVAEAIQSRAKIFGLGERITRVLVPTEKVVEVRNKQKRETEQKFFPGYVLIEMELTDETWQLVRATPKVTRVERLSCSCCWSRSRLRCSCRAVAATGNDAEARHSPPL